MVLCLLSSLPSLLIPTIQKSEDCGLERLFLSSSLYHRCMYKRNDRRTGESSCYPIDVGDLMTPSYPQKSAYEIFSLILF